MQMNCDHERFKSAELSTGEPEVTTMSIMQMNCDHRCRYDTKQQEGYQVLSLGPAELLSWRMVGACLALLVFPSS